MRATVPRIVDEVELSARLSLTERELEVLRCAARGLSSVETGRELFIARQTVKFHKTSIYSKLRARGIGHAIAIGYQRGILRLEGDPEIPPPVVEIDGVRYVPETPETP